MNVRLTNYDAGGHRWSPDRTVRVTPHYAAHGMLPDLRNKPTGYEVFDTLNRHTTGVPNLGEARRVADDMLAARPRLDWGPWTPPDPGTPDTPVRQCAAPTGTPAGQVVAWVWLSGELPHRGMWAVGYSIGGHDHEWLSDIRHIPHRMAHVRAIAEHRILKTGAHR